MCDQVSKVARMLGSGLPLPRQHRKASERKFVFKSPFRKDGDLKKRRLFLTSFQFLRMLSSLKNLIKLFKSFKMTSASASLSAAQLIIRSVGSYYLCTFA